MDDPNYVRVALIFVVRNEAQGIRSILPGINLKSFDQVIAIDGNSSDDSVAALQSFGVAAFRQIERGLGSAMLEARARVCADAFIFYHPDGNEDPNDLPRMAQLLRQGTEFIVASRMIPGAVNEDDGKLLKWRKWANCGFAFVANFLFGQNGHRTTDVTNGFRGISCRAWDRMQLSSKDLTMDYQMVIRALKLGVKITEFPTAEGNRIAGATNFASLPTGIAELKLVWRELRMGRRAVIGPTESATAEVPEKSTAAQWVSQ